MAQLKSGTTIGGNTALHSGNLNNTLTSTSTSQALTAAQGKVLRDTTVKKQDTDLTVTVGSSGDFATINAALTHLSNLYPEYKNTGVTATISLQAGFVMSEQVLVRGIDFGWVTITGADSQTTINHSSLTTNFTSADYGRTSFPAFGVSKGGTLPRIGQLFIFNVAGVGGYKHGIMAIGAGSSADVLFNCGVVNAGTYGIFAYGGSIINARFANATGAGTIGMVANGGSTINANEADVGGASSHGFYAEDGSTINAEDVDARSVGGSGFRVRYGSFINVGDGRGTTNIAVNTLTEHGIIFEDD